MSPREPGDREKEFRPRLGRKAAPDRERVPTFRVRVLRKIQRLGGPSSRGPAAKPRRGRIAVKPPHVGSRRCVVKGRYVPRMPRIKTLKVPPQKFDFFTFEELEALVATSASEPEWHAAVLVAGEGGLRLGELFALEWTDVDFKNGLLTVMRNDWRGTIGAPKSGRDRKIPLTTRVTAALKAIRHLKGKLVFCWGDGSRWTNSTIRAGLKRQAKGAGLRVTGWHVLRHTFCSHLAMRGAPAIAIKELAGHSSIAVTNRYTHLAPGGAARSAIALLERPRTDGPHPNPLPQAGEGTGATGRQRPKCNLSA
jgi:integrase